MSLLTISKKFRFEAAHVLPWHDGKCSRLHGHSYVLEVSIRGPIKPDNPEDPQSGMVMDFARLGSLVKTTVETKLDHHSLNDLMHNPTAENLVDYLVTLWVGPLHAEGVKLMRVRLYETETSWAEWNRMVL